MEVVVVVGGLFGTLTSVYCSQGFNIILKYVKKFIGCCLWGFLTMVLVLLTIFL